MRTTHLVALAIDMPFITAEQLRVLCSLAGERCGVVPAIGERAEPLAAIYTVEVAGDFVAALAGTDFSLQRVIRKLAVDEKVRVISVPPEHGHFYLSVNEPGDVR
jgi:molybdopterin-guanine dinucleotide biosynthesis protein A